MFLVKFLKSALFFTIISLLLSACAGMATPPTSTPKPQATKTAILMSTLTPTDIPTSTVSPGPSATPAPLKPSKTPDFKATEIAKFPVQCEYPNAYWSAISPDENWLAISCKDNHNEIIEIVSRDGQHQVLQFKDYLSKNDVKDGVPIGRLLPQQWSDDGKFLYFSPFINYSGGGSCFYGIDGQGLYRIKVDDGTVSAVLPSSSLIWGYHFAISPTGRRVAYLGHGNPTILDFKTGQETTFYSGEDIGGDFTWSEDGLELAYAACQSKYEQDNYFVSKSAILIYSIRENSSRTILTSTTNALRIADWNGNILKVFHRDEYGKETYLFFDVSTNQWLTPTPEP